MLTATTPFDPGRRVRYQITLAELDDQRVEIKCIGRVTRSAPFLQLGSQAFRVAVTLDRYEFKRQDLVPEGSGSEARHKVAYA
jgi:hypothetical protein